MVTLYPHANPGMINVRAYGATGDGATDDTAAFTAALAALTAGRQLYVPKGVYRVNAGTIVLTANDLAIVGENCDGSIIDIVGAGIGVKVGSAVISPSLFRIANITIRRASGASGVGVHFEQISQLRVDHVRVNDHPSHGFYVKDCITGTWIHPYATDNTDTGLYVEGVTTNQTIIGGRLNSNDQRGVRITGASVNKVVFFGTDIEGNQNGGLYIDASSGYPASFYNCWIESNATADAQVTVTGGSYGVLFQECHFASGTGVDIKIDNARATLVLDCELGTTTGTGIWLTSSSTNTVIMDRKPRTGGVGPVNLRDESGGNFTLQAARGATSLMEGRATVLEDGERAHAYGGFTKTRTNRYPYGKFDTVNATTDGANAPTVTQDVAEGFAATPALKIAFPGGTSSEALLSDNVAVTDAQRVWVTFKAKASAAAHKKVRVQLRDGTGGTIFGSMVLDLTTVWRQYAFTVVPSATTATGRVHFVVDSAIGSALNVWVDELQVETNESTPGAFIPTNGAAVTAAAGAVFNAVHSRNVRMTGAPSSTAGTYGYSGGPQAHDGTNARGLLWSPAAAGTPAWVTGLAASTTRTPSTTRPTLVTVAVRLGTTTAGAAGSVTITHDGRAAPAIYVQNPLAAGAWNETKTLCFLLPPNAGWSFTTAGTVSGVDAVEQVL